MQAWTKLFELSPSNRFIKVLGIWTEMISFCPQQRDKNIKRIAQRNELTSEWPIQAVDFKGRLFNDFKWYASLANLLT